MAESFADSGVYIVKVIFGLYGLLVMVRFLMQIARVDYYNPICQGIIRVTEPAHKPLSFLFPAIRGVNFATLVLAFLITLASLMLISLLLGYGVFQVFFLTWVPLALFGQILDIYFWSLLIIVIASWIAPTSRADTSTAADRTLVHPCSKVVAANGWSRSLDYPCIPFHHRH